MSSTPSERTSPPATQPDATAEAGIAPTGLRVLIVEDEPLVAMEIAMQLEDQALIPLGPATSCRQALTLIETQQPDLVLLDGNLNGERVDGSWHPSGCSEGCWKL